MRPATLLVASLLAALPGCGGSDDSTGGVPSTGKVVVLYCSLDEPFSEFIKEEFRKQTGIEVRFNPDTEADKSVGNRARIFAERNNPVCDVFWNNEPGNTEVLRQAGLLQPYKSPAAAGIPDDARYMDPDGYWTGFAARTRVLIINTDHVKPADEPTSFDDVLKWGGKAAIALPVAGTTATHAAALYAKWGKARARSYFQKIKIAGVVVATGNANVMTLVSDGEVHVGWTDSDDVHVAVKKGRPVKVIYPDQGPSGRGTFVLANTVMMIKGAPHPEEARKLIDYILSTQIEERLAMGESAQMPLRPGVKTPDPPPPGFIFDYTKIKQMDYDPRKVGALLPEVIEEMRKLFLR